MIIHEYKTIFIHIPKNAGTSIKHYFSDNVEEPFKHRTIYDIKKQYPDLYKNYKKFAIVRNPYDRMVSWYSYLTGYYIGNSNLNIVKEGKIVGVKKADINGFQEWIKDMDSLWMNRKHLLNCQNTWVDNSVEILKYENLENDLSNFFNIEIKLQKKNKSSIYDYLKYLNKEIISIINKKYDKDFKKFNYKKL